VDPLALVPSPLSLLWWWSCSPPGCSTAARIRREKQRDEHNHKTNTKQLLHSQY